jgi:hypothetical protein
LFASAECHAGWGKVATALARYSDYVGLVTRLPAEQQARHRDRASGASAQIEKLRPSVPTLTVTLASGAPPGTVVRRGGVELKGAALGLALPLDPGEHVLTVQAPGGVERRVTVKLELGQHQRVELEPPPAPPAAATFAPASASPPTTDEQPEVNPRRTLGYVAGGVGLLGVAVGATAGVLVLGKKSTVDEECDGAACRSREGLDAAESGQTLATVSTVGFAVGVVGLGSAAVLLLTSGSADERARAPRWRPLVAAGPHGALAGVTRPF